MNVSSHQESYQQDLVSQKRLLGYGTMMESCVQPQPREVIEDIAYLTQRNSTPPLDAPSSMQESLLENNNMTSNDRFVSSNNIIQPLRSSRTLDLESTSKERVYKPFWNSQLEETYKMLWLPIETDLQDLGLNSSSSCLKSITLISKCCRVYHQKNQSQSWQKTSLPLLQSSPPDTMGQENIRHCKKIRIYPNKEQTELFQQCLGAYRFFYNKANHHLKEQSKNEEKLSLSLPKLRKQVLRSDKEIQDGDDDAWQKRVPYDTRQEAIADAIVSWKVAFSNLKAKNIQRFDIGFKSKKATSQIFRVNKNALKCDQENDKRNVFVTRLKKKSKLRMRKRDIKTFYEDGIVDGNFIVLKTRPNYWYLCLPRTKDKPVIQEPSYKNVFLDPGVRSFQTFYSPQGVCGKIHVNPTLYKKAEKHDKLHSVSSNMTTKTKYNVKRRMAILRNDMKNIVNDLHWQTCSYLCKNFQTIVLPPFEVSKMVVNSPLGSKVTRKMLTLSHGKFKERLKWYCTTRGTNLLEESEEYTTKTCGCCGHLQEMNSKKVYECGRCGTSIDRDYNGARNICLKALTRVMVHTL